MSALLQRSAVIIALVAAAACDQSPDRPAASPTAPSAAWPTLNGFGINRTGAADLGACLAATSPRCFDAARLTTTSVTGAAVTSPPSSLSAQVSGSTVMLVWTAPAFEDDPVSSYVIDVGSTANFAAPDLASLDTGNPATSLTVPQVPPGTYHVRIRARNAFGLSDPSNEIEVVVGTGLPGPGCPGAPRALTGSTTAGVVSLTWLAPLSGTAESYVIEAGSATGAANLANFNTGNSATSFAQAGIPAGVYYVRVRTAATGCAPSPPSNEIVLSVGTGSGDSPLVTLRLAYSCSFCTGDPDNYALNIDCVSGRCTVFRSSNPRSSGVITATMRMAPGVHNVEVVAASASWSLTFSATPSGAGGVVPNSYRLIFPSSGGGLNFGPCQVSGTIRETFFEFLVSGAGTPTC